MLEFYKIHRKTPVQESLFNKVAGLRSATLLKKRLWRKCFPVNFVKFLRTPFFIERLWWLLLNIQNTSNKFLSEYYLWYTRKQHHLLNNSWYSASNTYYVSISLHKICENTVFHWSDTRYPCSRIFYAVYIILILVSVVNTDEGWRN